MTPNKERAIAALLTSKTKQEAAAAAGITDRTLRKYFEDRDFQEAYNRAFAGVLEDATRQAQQSASSCSFFTQTNGNGFTESLIEDSQKSTKSV